MCTSSRGSRVSSPRGGRIFRSWSRKAAAAAMRVKSPALGLGSHLPENCDWKGTVPFSLPYEKSGQSQQHHHDALHARPGGFLSGGLCANQAALDAVAVAGVVRAGGGRGDAQRHPRAGEQPRGIAGDDRRPDPSGSFVRHPRAYTPETRDVPTAEEVAPWVETIIRLWDDAAEYDRWSRAARERAQAWHPDRLAPLYRDFFSRIVQQPSHLLAKPTAEC